MASFELLAVVISMLGISASIIYYANVINNANKTQKLQLETRQAQLFMSRYNRTNEVEFWEKFIEIQQWEWENYEEYNIKYRNRKEMRSIFNSIGAYFEGMGVMVYRNLIDVTLVDDLTSGPLMSLWEKFEPIILEDRKRRNMPTIWEWFEYLYNRVKEVSEKEHGTEHVIDVSRLQRPLEAI